MTTIGDRIKKIRRELDLTQQEFADRIGIKRGGVANYEINRNVPIDAVISLICKTFNVREEWLRTGNGEIFVEMSRDEQIATFIGRIQMEDGDSFKKRLIAVLSEMTEDQWEMLAEMAQKLAGEKEKD